MAFHGHSMAFYGHSMAFYGHSMAFFRPPTFGQSHHQHSIQTFTDYTEPGESSHPGEQMEPSDIGGAVVVKKEKAEEVAKKEEKRKRKNENRKIRRGTKKIYSFRFALIPIMHKILALAKVMPRMPYKVRMPFQCDQCPTRLRKAENLTRHKFRVHGLGPFPCDKFPQSFECFTGLTQHSESSIRLRRPKRN